ncbi:hypothetical protein ACQP2P_11255 [Dactylosporangium sp. CA-139114]|uniref:hypothetical protein n=1 Tax=Dactylosporangium sp. CA-139114 TaxID=3239931 RepID=UPI003D955E97
MNPHETARVRRPRDAVEHRLGTVTDIIYPNPHTTYIGGIRLRFATGEERTYRPEAVVACTRADDHAALVAAVTDTCRTLRDACRIAHDYDGRLSGDIIDLLMALLGVAEARLGLTLDPANLDPPTGGNETDEVPS